MRCIFIMAAALFAASANAEIPRDFLTRFEKEAHTERFTDAAKVDKWFRRNCNDTLNRLCSAQENLVIAMINGRHAMRGMTHENPAG